MLPRLRRSRKGKRTTDRFKHFWDTYVKPGLDVITLAVSVVGLFSIWIAIHEMRVNEEVSWVTTYQSIESVSLELDKMIVDHPTLVKYFLSGQTIDENSSEYNQAISVADARIGAIDAILSYAAFRHADDKIVGWEQTFTNYFSNSPLMCQRLSKNKSYYGLVVELGSHACGFASSPANLIRDPMACLKPPYKGC